MGMLLNAHQCIMCVPAVLCVQNEVDVLELDLQLAVSHHVVPES